MGPIDRSDTWWIIAFGVDRDTGARNARQIIDAAAGVPVDAEVLSTDPWSARTQLVDHLRRGRVFLAGDAAHLNPPFGGHGLDTGVGDAVDLGWKLAAVLDRWDRPSLLDSFEAERRPVQDRMITEATANMRVLSTELLSENLDADDADGEQARKAADAQIQATKAADFHALDPGARHRARRLAGRRPGREPAPWTPRGGLLPHAWLGGGVSLYDRLGTGLTLLVRCSRCGTSGSVTSARSETGRG